MCITDFLNVLFLPFYPRHFNDHFDNMKLSTLLLAPLVLAFDNQNAASPSILSTQVLPPQLRTNANRTVTKLGPLFLKPVVSSIASGSRIKIQQLMSILQNAVQKSKYAVDPNGQVFTWSIPKTTLCSGCTILQGKVSLVFEDGAPVVVSNGVYIHHIVSTVAGKKTEPFISQCDIKCNNISESTLRPAPQNVSRGFLGAGDDNGDTPVTYTSPDGNFNAGFWLEKDDVVVGLTELVHSRNVERTVYVLYDVEFVDGLIGVNSQGTTIDVHGCGGGGHGGMVSTEGFTNTTSGKFVLWKDGTILNASKSSPFQVLATCCCTDPAVGRGTYPRRGYPGRFIPE